MLLDHDDLQVRANVKDCQDLIQQFENMNLHAWDLLKIETRLAAKLTFLLGKKAKYQYEQNSAYWVRKIEHSRESIKARKSGETKNQQMADHIGHTKNLENREQENLSVWRYEHLKGFCSGIEKVLIAIAHRLKDLSAEKAASDNQQG